MDTANIVFVLFSSALVFLMTLGLAFFYGGLGRRKNVINTMMMVVIPIAIAIVMWFLAGYSLAFSGSGKFVGNFGLLYGGTHLFGATIAAILITAVWSGIFTFIIIKIIGVFMPIRASDREEAVGMDDSEHKETAYPTFMGLDS